MRCFVFIFLFLSSVALAAPAPLRPELQEAERQIYTDPMAALARWSQLKQVLDPQKDLQNWIELHLWSARAESLLGNSANILGWAAPIVPLVKASDENGIHVRLHVILGEGYEFGAKGDLAREHYTKAVTLARASKRPELIAYALHFQAWMHNRNKEEKQALTLLKEAFGLMKDQPRGLLFHELLNNLGNLYSNKEVGREVEGRKLLEEARDYFLRENYHFYASTILYNIGLAYQAKQPKVAQKAFEDALKSAERIQEQGSIAYAHYGLGLTYSHLSHKRDSLTHLRKALSLFEATNNPMMAFEVKRQIVIIAASSGLYREAEALLPETENHYKDSGANPDHISLLESKIAILRDKGQTMEELETYRKVYPLLLKNIQEQDRETINRYTALFDLERSEHERDLLEKQNRLQTLELEKQERTRKVLLGASLLVLSIMLLLLRNVLKDREMKKQRADLQNILDSVHEGIIRFGPDEKILPLYSQHIHKLLGRDKYLAEQSISSVFFDRLELSSEARNLLRETLQAAWGEDRLVWDLNHFHLPTEAGLDEKHLDIYWQPLEDGAGRIQQIQLIIRDVTESRQLQHKLFEERLKAERQTRKIQEVLRGDKQLSLRVLRDLKQRLPQLEDLWVKGSHTALLRELHTIKGNGRSVGLEHLAEVTHRLESQFKDARVTIQSWVEWRECCQDYLAFFHDTLGTRLQQRRTLADVCLEILPGLREHLDQHGRSLHQIRIEDELSSESDALLQVFHDILLHGLTNAIDHGYLLSGTNRPVILRIRSWEDQAQIYLDIRDQGKGLNWPQLQSLAEKRGFTPLPGRSWSDVLFLDGLSTAENVSRTSGRGVGLSAIRQLCSRHAGEVILLDNDEATGTLLRVSFPKSTFFLNDLPIGA